jgi:site-specific recombinase XerD
MTLEETRQKYLETIALFLRPCTVTNARTVLGNFIRYLTAHHPRVSSFSELKREHIEGWLRDLARRPLRRSTRRNMVIKLRVFLESIRVWGWKEAPSGPLFRAGDLPPEDKLLPRPLSTETDRALGEELRRRGGIIHDALLLLRATGLRAQELMDLEVQSLRRLSADDWALHVPLGKLHSERVIPMDTAAAKIFQRMLEHRGDPPPVAHPETRKPTHFLLAHPNGPRYGRDVLRYHLNKIEREIRLSEHPSPHRLRHTFATEMLRAGLRIPILMKLLGHRSIGMTLRYVKITEEDVRRCYLEALAATKRRYDIPLAPAGIRPQAESQSPQATHSRLLATAAALESYRRDATSSADRRTLQRIVERIRKLARDLERFPT